MIAALLLAIAIDVTTGLEASSTSKLLSIRLAGAERCYVTANEHGDVRIEGSDTAPCIDKLDEAVRLAKAARAVNAKRKRGAR